LLVGKALNLCSPPPWSSWFGIRRTNQTGWRQQTSDLAFFAYGDETDNMHR
jgi:hypothetical protein